MYFPIINSYLGIMFTLNAFSFSIIYELKLLYEFFER